MKTGAFAKTPSPQREYKLRHEGANKRISPLPALRLGERRKHDISHGFVLDIQNMAATVRSDLNDDR